MKTLDKFLSDIVAMERHALAKQYAVLLDELAGTGDDVNGAAYLRRMLCVVEAIGDLKWPGSWPEAKEAA